MKKLSVRKLKSETTFICSTKVYPCVSKKGKKKKVLYGCSNSNITQLKMVSKTLLQFIVALKQKPLEHEPMCDLPLSSALVSAMLKQPRRFSHLTQQSSDLESSCNVASIIRSNET